MSAFERWYLRSAPPERLAMLRILVGAFAFVYAVIRVPDLWTYSDFSASRFHPVGITGLLDGPLSPSVWHGLLLLTVLLNAALSTTVRSSSPCHTLGESGPFSSPVMPTGWKRLVEKSL